MSKIMLLFIILDTVYFTVSLVVAVGTDELTYAVLDTSRGI